MLDIGWSELLVIAVVLIVVVGPKDLPPMLRAFGKMMTRLRKTAGEFRSQFDEALREADMEDVAKTISDVRRMNPASSIRDAVNPLRQLGDDLKNDLRKASSPPPEMPSPLPPVTSELVEQSTVKQEPAPATAPVAPVAPEQATASASAPVAEKPKRTTRKSVAADTSAVSDPVAPVKPRATRTPKTEATATSKAELAKSPAARAAPRKKAAALAVDAAPASQDATTTAQPVKRRVKKDQA